jgi:predicted amidohydrolase YtcJ
MEKKQGSVEVGKDANLTVLDRSPHAVAPDRLKDITVWGTMLEGRVQPVPRRMPKAAQRSAQAAQLVH